MRIGTCSRGLVANTGMVCLLLGAGGWIFFKHGRSIWVPLLQSVVGPRTVNDVVAALEHGAGKRVRDAFVAAGVPAETRNLWLVAIKDARTLELFGEDGSGRRVRVRTWRVLAASGKSGPKLREGDHQVPEGIYRIKHLNPNSAFHLSLKLDYPNLADRARATQDGRQNLGGDIFIHGKDVSVGCLAIGDEAIEELFWLVGTSGKDRFTVVIVPTDLRRSTPEMRGPAWVAELYRELTAELKLFP
jgi:L,D-transpeptidase catalytic domain